MLRKKVMGLGKWLVHKKSAYQKRDIFFCLYINIKWLLTKGGGSTRQHNQIRDVKYLNIKLGQRNFNHSTKSFITFITRRDGGKSVKNQYLQSFRLL